MSDGTNDQNRDDAIKRMKAHLQAGRLADTIADAENFLKESPDDLDALYVLAVAHRYSGAFDAAQTTLDRLKAAYPHYGRAYQEQGHLNLKTGREKDALKAFAEAVFHNPALHASWKSLAELYDKAGQSADADRARGQAQRLAGIPPELVSVTSFMHEGRLLKAETLCRAFLQNNPTHIEAMRLLAQLGMRLHVLDDAEFLLESCVALNPDYVPSRMDYVVVLQKRQKFARALEEAETLVKTDPGNPAFLNLQANAAMAIGQYETALGIFDGLLSKTPDPAPLHLARGHAFKTIGRQDDAVAAYRKAYTKRPDFGDAFWSLANLKTYQFTDDEIAAMREAEAAPDIRPADRYHMCFALGKALEDRKDYAGAFPYYERGNRLKREELRYSADRMEADLKRQIEHCTPELFAARSGQGCPAPDPIFIVGLPRAGSTLLEQILASHSSVDGTLELPNILAMAHRLSGRRLQTDDPKYPAILHELPGEKLQELGQTYIDDTRIHRQAAPFFTDKMPNNFRHIGLIHLILPNAKIIDARRSPLSCCFSGFKQLFAEGQEFTYGLEQIGRYYRNYVELMDHWDRVLPGKVLRVQYEDVVADLEGQVRRALNFCGLDFEPACIEFHKTERSVRTASSEQVRQPIYASGVEQWRHFEAFLDPLKDALGPALADGTER